MTERGKPPGVAVRRATPADAPAVAALHADSWRRHYRGAYPDDFLDGPVVEDRLAVWGERLADTRAPTVTLVAEDPATHPIEMVGFVHVVLDADAEHGALVDNLHVRHDRKGGGLGTTLLARAAGAVLEKRPGSGLFLWVLEKNVAAQAFYRSRGGVVVGSRMTTPPGGGATLVALRCTWSDPRPLAEASGPLAESP